MKMPPAAVRRARHARDPSAVMERDHHMAMPRRPSFSHRFLRAIVVSVALLVGSMTVAADVPELQAPLLATDVTVRIPYLSVDRTVLFSGNVPSSSHSTLHVELGVDVEREDHPRREQAWLRLDEVITDEGENLVDGPRYLPVVSGRYMYLGCGGYRHRALRPVAGPITSLRTVRGSARVIYAYRVGPAIDVPLSALADGRPHALGSSGFTVAMAVGDRAVDIIQDAALTQHGKTMVVIGPDNRRISSRTIFFGPDARLARICDAQGFDTLISDTGDGSEPMIATLGTEPQDAAIRLQLEPKDVAGSTLQVQLYGPSQEIEVPFVFENLSLEVLERPGEADGF